MARIFFAILTLATLSGCGTALGELGKAEPAPSQFEPVYVRDDYGRAVVLRGTNDSNEAKHSGLFLSSYPASQIEDQAEDFGFNFVRLLIFWAAIEPERGVYNEAYLDAVEARVKLYQDQGMHVMLDMHQDIYGYAISGGNGAPAWATETGGLPPINPGGPWWLKSISPDAVMAFVNFFSYTDHKYLQDHYIRAWQHVAERFKDNPAVIAYEVMNEPHAGDIGKALTREFEAQWLSDFYGRIIPAIREVDNDTYIAFEPQAMAVNFGWPSRLRKISDTRVGEQRLIYAPHLYPFGIEEGQGYGDDQRLQVQNWKSNRLNELQLHGTPLILGEIGAFGDTQPNIQEFIESTTGFLDNVGGGLAIWDNSIIGTGDEPAQKTRWFVRTYPRAIAGDPVDWSYDPASKHFELTYTSSPFALGETEVYIPRMHYPNGFDWSFSDPDGSWSARWDPNRDILYLTHNPFVASHTLTITPR